MLQTTGSSVRRFRLAPQLLVITLCCGALGAQTLVRDNAPLDFNAYRAELDRISQAASRLDAHSEEAQALRHSLPKKWTVNDRGTNHEISTARLAEDLDQYRKDPQNGSYRASLKRRIAALETEASTIGPEPSSSNDARRKLAEILARREFRSA